MKSKKRVFKCEKCPKLKFKDKWYRDYHVGQEHEVFVSYLSLAQQGWGIKHSSRKEAEAFKKSPSHQALLSGYLEAILGELRSIKSELRRERTIK